MFSIALSPLLGVDVCVYCQLLANNNSLNDIQDTMGHILACCCCNEHVSIQLMLQLLIAVYSWAFIPADTNLKAMFWINSHGYNGSKAEIQSQEKKKKKPNWFWGGYNDSLTAYRTHLFVGRRCARPQAVLPACMRLRKIHRTDLMWQTWINTSHRSLKKQFVWASSEYGKSLVGSQWPVLQISLSKHTSN